ncbi:MAG: ATP-binding protein, partial [Coriobacteriales bacterium]|nr:ATP-binding protein [Coriobacteriales bacterium]
MLTEEDFDLFRQFRIKAMGDKLREMVDDPAYDELTFEERMKVLLDAEASARRDRKVAKLVREARFKDPSACVEDLLYLPNRKLSKDRVARWAECRWVEECEVMVVISKSGC